MTDEKPTRASRRRAEGAFRNISNLLLTVDQAVQEAPIEYTEKQALAVMIAAHFLGSACGALGVHPLEDGKAVADRIVDSLNKLKH